MLGDGAGEVQSVLTGRKHSPVFSSKEQWLVHVELTGTDGTIIRGAVWPLAREAVKYNVPSVSS